MEKRTLTSFALFSGSLLAAFVHNQLSALCQREEPLSLIAFFLLLGAFFISLIYNVVTYTKKGIPEDLWKLGWLGLFCLLGLVPGLKISFFGFAGFFGFFGLWENKGGNK